MNLEEIKELIFKIFGVSQQSTELIAFFIFIERFGLNEAENLYPPKIFNDYISKLEIIGLLGKKLQQKENIENLELNFTCNLEWIRYFVAYSKVEDINRAAKILNITSQGLNKAIIGLEKHFKVNLIERNKYGKGTTMAGKTLAKKGAEMLQKMNDINIYFNSINSNIANETISIGFYIIGTNVWQLLHKYKLKYPDIGLNLSFLHIHEIERKITHSELDLAFIPFKPTSEKLYDYILIQRCKYVIVGKPQPKKNWDDFEYIEVDYGYKKDKLEAFKFKSANIKVEALNIAIKFCEEGFGVLKILDIHIQHKLNNGTMAIVADMPAEEYVDFYLVWNKDVYMTKKTRNFINIVKKHLIVMPASK